MFLSQIRAEDGTVQVVARDGTEAYVICDCASSYALAADCADRNIPLKQRIGELGLGPAVDVAGALAEGRVLPPILHPDPAQMIVSGDAMLGGGAANAPDWLFKGDGRAIGAPGLDLVVADAVHRPSVAVIYIISQTGVPFRAGFALASDFSGQAMTTRAYCGLAQGALRPVALGPEMVLGALPPAMAGGGVDALEQGQFASALLRQPGALHIHLFAIDQNMQPATSDKAELALSGFGLPLCNTLRRTDAAQDAPVRVTAL
jgi:hypothetical protein